MPPTTETVSEDFLGLDTWADEAVLAALIDGQFNAIAAVRAALPSIAAAATDMAQRLKAGGRLFYAGAGTSIRIGVQDGSELHATFGMADEKIGYFIAGGRAAMFETMADAEDDGDAGSRAAAGAKLTPGDVVIAIAASGATPYAVAVARAAKAAGALVIAIANNAGSPLAAIAGHEILIATGPEVIAGSTRLGAGTAQKAALNLLSTLTHIKLGAVHDGYMVNVQAGNAKLRRRARGIVCAISGADDARAAKAIEIADGNVKLATLLCAGARDAEDARARLDQAHGNLRLAMGGLVAAS